ncbi:MAG: hypothetical protein MUC62_07700 [Candidatus Thermoplasmatota archaeon]|jgi:hypothetical protein|nr:hypothetical protein [Candidatus Thermoplasmatota archaeon]
MVKKTAATEEKEGQVTVPTTNLDVYKGEFKDRRYGIRIDDDIEVIVIAGNDVIKVRGRLLSMKEEIELLGEDGNYIQIMADWVVAIKVLKHNRPPPDQDQELIKKPPVKTKPKKPSVDHAYY